MGAEEFVDSLGGARKFGVIVIMDDDNSPLYETRDDEPQAGLDRAIEVSVAEGEGDALGKILRTEVVEPGLLDNDR